MGRYSKKNDPNGEKVLPSVTQIISDCTNSSGPLTQWAANMAVQWIKENCTMEGSALWKNCYRVSEKELNDARFNFRNVSKIALSVGKEVHTEIENHLKGEPRNLYLSIEGNKAFSAFLKWKNEVNLKPVLLEEVIYGNGWAGTLDFYGYYKNQLYVIDWKTSAGHYPEQYGPQVAAYRYGLFKKGYRVKGSGILRIDKETGIPDWEDYSDRYIKDLLVFNAMIKLYMARYPEIARIVKE